MTMPNTTTSSASSTATIPGFITVIEAAKILRTTPGALRKRIERGQEKGKYRTVKAGRTILIPNEVMLALFEEQQQER